MNALLGKIAAASFGLSTALFAVTSAQAAVSCNAAGDCWHTHEEYTYPPAAGIVIHPDSWKWEGESSRWREHKGRGYWHGDKWEGF
jgi:hypothetical protein